MAVASLRCRRGLTRHQEKEQEEKKRRLRNHQQSQSTLSVKRRRKTNATQLNDLPLEILSDILSRLPATSLLVVKKTCKLWGSIVNDPVFYEYLKSIPARLYTLVGDSNLYFTQDGDDDVSIKLSGELGDPHRYNSFSSCAGLICYSSIPDKSVFICNPLIPNESVKLPLPTFDALTWGFGYAPLSKKYKYVQFSVVKQPKMQLIAGVFTIGDQSWREVAVPSDIHLWRRSATYCNESLYWSLAHESEHHVMSFDLETEKVRPRRVFPIGTGHDLTASCYSTYLTVLGESVAFVIRSTGGLH